MDGFQIYRNEEQKRFLKRLAAQRGIIIATDSDAAGFQIRAYLKDFLPPERVRHVLIPDATGKERRKKTPSKEGKLGVEGMDSPALLEAFRRAGITQSDADNSEYVTKQDLYRDGFSGTAGSRERYHELLKTLDLPARLSTNLFCACVTMKEYREAKNEDRSGI